jgi:hypothetical protein
MDCQALAADELLRHFWRLANTQQWAAMGQLLAPDLRYELPQTREFIAGREGFVDFFATWPQPWQVVLERCVVQGDEIALQMRFEDDSAQTQTCVGFYELANGLIQRIVEYWPESYEPPVRHSAHVRRQA